MIDICHEISAKQLSRYFIIAHRVWGLMDLNTKPFWHERAAFQLVGVRACQSLVATINVIIFLFPPFFLRRNLFS